MTDISRLQELEDREAIRQLFVDYGRFIDSGDYAGYVSLFARDGVFGDAVGTEAIAAHLKQYGARVDAAKAEGVFKPAIHIMSNHDIDIQGDSATVDLLWCYLTTDADETPTVLQTGRYTDELIREDGVWKIARHQIGRIMGRAQMEAPARSRMNLLEERLKLVEDREAIQRLFVDLSNCLDNRDLQGYGALFTEDGEWCGIVGRAVGPADIATILGKYCKPWESEGQRTYHTTVDMVIDIAGDRAKATSKWQHIVRSEGDVPVVLHLGHYDDRLVRTSAGWRFTRRAAYGDIPYFEPKFQLIGLAAADELG